MTSIHAIDQYSVHRICSGQVILDLSMAVKELVENSLDAGATTIEVKFKENGLDMIEVSDNGSGIEPANYEALALKHHTSKIETFEDLGSVMTFGFRGEALSSLCALGELVVTTSTMNEQPRGVKLTYDASGKLVSTEPIARNAGTTVQVRNLFHSLPVRKQEFKRNIKKEYPKALAILQAYSLISRGTRFIVSNQTAKGSSTQALVTKTNKTIRDNIIDVFGTKILQQILPYNVEFTLNSGSLVKVEGFISKPVPGCGRSSTDRQYFYVNGRPCIISKVSKAINDAYKSQVPSQNPFIIANIMMGPSTYDVNVTPDKREILLHNGVEVAEKFAESISQQLQSSSTVELNTQESRLSRSTLLQTGSLRPNVQQPSPLNSGSSPTLVDEDTPLRRPDLPSPRGLAGLHPVASPGPSTMTEKPAWLSTIHERTQRNDPVRLPAPAKKRQATVTAFLTKRPKTPLPEDDVEGARMSPPARLLPTPSHAPYSVRAAEQESVTDDEHMVDELDDDEDEDMDDEIPVSSSCEGNTSARWNTHGQERTLKVDDDTFLPKILTSALKAAQLHKQQNCPPTQLVESTSVFASTDDEVAADALSRVIHKHDFHAMKVIGQFNKAFILVLLDDYDIFIVDQHASDEKYNFEQLQLTTPMEGQRLVIPHCPELTVSEELVAIEHADILRKNGFNIIIDHQELPGKRIKVLSQPMSNKKLFDKKDFSELIHLLTESPGQMVTCSSVRAMYASRACRKSYMFGDALRLDQMYQIIKHMGEIENPWNCPHGRPTVRHLHRLERQRQNAPERKLTFQGSLFRARQEP